MTNNTLLTANCSAEDSQDRISSPPSRKRKKWLWRMASPFAVTLLVVITGADRQPASPHESVPLLMSDRLRCTTNDTLRVATFNIHGGRNRAGVRDLDLTARTIADADFVGIQEAYGSLWTERRDQCELLGERLQSASLFAPTERRWWRDNIGNGVLSRVPLRNALRIPLSGTQDGRFRNAILCEAPLNSATVRMLVVHVDNQRDHDKQLAAVIGLFRSLQTPAVLLGDLNTHGLDPQLCELMSDEDVTAVIGESFSDGRRMRGVDWIIARGMECVSSETRDLGASDHPAIVAELAIPAGDRSSKKRVASLRNPGTHDAR